ncbi:uncharacterized protein SOCE26_079820 [Sorangium cellulosum]|uniref:Uncharacterized protein n=1 Tax=Sorangium cellulosum TaxID=56 RepID=A0A2L0F4K7_SORCE|nr:hypothetical protein [Sorangium cellulosum]AUX46476.1 uncharacterized protein SOCE26_079820 [Sorangium cellulosum]
MFRVALPVLAGVAAGAGSSLLFAKARGSERAPEPRASIVDAARPALGALGPAQPSGSPEDAARVVERFQGALADHDLAPVEPGWASRTGAALGEALVGLKDRARFTIVEVDCRTRSCAATLEWTSYTDATNDAPAILHARYRADCGKTVLMPPPEDPASVYRTRVLFECDPGAPGEQE